MLCKRREIKRLHLTMTTCTCLASCCSSLGGTVAPAGSGFRRVGVVEGLLGGTVAPACSSCNRGGVVSRRVDVWVAAYSSRSKRVVMEAPAVPGCNGEGGVPRRVDEGGGEEPVWFR